MNIHRPISRQPLPADARLVFKGKLFDTYQWEVKGYDGQMHTFEKLKRADTVMVLPVTDDGKIVLSMQEQPGKEPFWGSLGGRVEEGEAVLEGAKRELLEESGFSSEDWELLDAVQPLSKIEWAVYTFIARDAKKVAEQNLDFGEKIELKFLSFEEFLKVATSEDFGDVEIKLLLLDALIHPEKMASLKKQLGLK